jgi:hypothetical protein
MDEDPGVDEHRPMMALQLEDSRLEITNRRNVFDVEIEKCAMIDNIPDDFQTHQYLQAMEYRNTAVPT